MFQVRKVSDEGTQEPFVARLLMGILELRDHALRSLFRGTDFEKHRIEFDEKYDPVLTALKVIRQAAKEIAFLVCEHAAEIASGAIVEFQRNAVNFRKNIDGPLHEATARLLANGVIALRHVQDVTKMFGINIGGFFQRPENFERHMDALKGQHRALEQYLRASRRVWSEQFIQQRADLEHNAWTLPQVHYEQSGPKAFKVREPDVCGLPVSEFAVLSSRRLFGFVENVVVYTFKTALDGPLTIFEIPHKQRDPHFPRRFQVQLKSQRKSEWLPTYTDDDFLSL